MKKIFLLVALSGFTVTFACNSPSESSGEKASDSTVLPPASSNSDATNSSVADTAYPKKDSVGGKTDSLRK